MSTKGQTKRSKTQREKEYHDSPIKYNSFLVVFVMVK